MRLGPVLVACLALATALAAGQELRPCTEADIVGSYTPCVNNLRSVVYFFAVPCAPNGLELPTTVANLSCTIECDDGEYLPLGQTTCAPCVPGTYSIGGGDMYDSWYALPTEFVTECTHFGISLRRECSPWRPSGTYVDSGNNRNATNLLSNLHLNAVFVAPSNNKIRFRYKVDAELNYDGFTFFIDGVAKTSFQSIVPWTTIEFPVTPGYHSFMWQFKKDISVDYGLDMVLISSIEVHGTDYSSDHCSPCRPGTYSSTLRANTCLPCAANTYSDYAYDVCEPCPANTYAFPGTGECMTMATCATTDFAPSYGQCDSLSKLRTVTYAPVLLANNSVPLCTGGTAPPTTTVPCSCELGHVLALDGRCLACPDGFAAQQRSEVSIDNCGRCPAGTAASKVLSFTKWDSIPSQFTTWCDGDCESPQGWTARGDHISSGYSMGGTIDSVLQIQVTVPEAGKLEFAYNLQCAKPSGDRICRLYLSYDNLDDDVYEPTSYTINQLSDSRVVKYTVYFDTPGNYVVEWKYNQKTSPFNKLNVFKLFNVTFTGVTEGSAEVCTPCRPGYSSTEGSTMCTPCPPGKYNPAAGGLCRAVPDGFFTDEEGAVEPKVCGNATASNPERTDCVTDCTYSDPLTGRRFDLNALYDPEIMHFAGRGASGHSYFVNMCSREHRNETCFDIEGRPIPSMACQELHDRNYAVDLGHVMGYGPLQPDLVRLAGHDPATVAGLTVELTYGDEGCAPTYGTARPRRTVVTLLCNMSAGIGNPEPLYDNNVELTPRSCVYHFLWRSHYACPLCVPGDYVYERGECIDGLRTLTPVRVGDCSGPPAVSPSYEACYPCAKTAAGACNGVGICDENTGTCTCPSRWTGEGCDQCATGIYGANCDKECPGGARSACNNHGVCNQGINGTGECTCASNFAGISCNICAEGFEGASCTPIPASIQDVVPWWVFIVIVVAALLVGVAIFVLWRQKRQAEYKYSLLAGNQHEMDGGGDFNLPNDDEREPENQ